MLEYDLMYLCLPEEAFLPTLSLFPISSIFRIIWAGKKTGGLRDIVTICLCLMLPLCATAATQEDSSQENTLGKQYLKNLFSDQKTIWTSPAHIRGGHLPWLIPFAAAAGGLFATDSNVVKQLSVSPSTISHNHTLANGGAALMVGGG